MFILRLAAYTLVVIAFFIVVADGARSIAARELVVTPAAAIAEALFPRWPEAITLIAGGKSLPAMRGLAENLALTAPAAIALLVLALVLVAADAAMQASLARMRRSLRRL
jgi:hypothetical protein